MKYIFMILAMLVALPGFAYDFAVDGIYYNILSEREHTLAVTKGVEGSYAGNVIIPSKVAYAGKSYTVTSIGKEIFYRRTATSVEIPSTVESIESTSFFMGSSLKMIIVDENNKKYCSYQGVLYSKDMTTLFYCPDGYAGIFIVPSMVKTIGDNAFRLCRDVTEVRLPDSVVSIGRAAFYECNMAKIKMSNTLEEIGEYAFSGCNNLKSLLIPSSVTTIGVRCLFCTSPLESIYCQWHIPLECNLGSYSGNTILYVPIGCKEAYQRVYPWSEFKNIQEIQYAGNEDVVDDESVPVSVENGVVIVGGESSAVTIYDMEGRTIYAGTERSIMGLAPGIYLVKIGKSTVKLSI